MHRAGRSPPADVSAARNLRPWRTDTSSSSYEPRPTTSPGGLRRRRLTASLHSASPRWRCASSSTMGR